MIKTVKWKDHPSLGNLELNFCKDDGTPYNTIILAGENGTGKTTVLETLSEFLTLGSIKNFEYIRYIANGENYLAKPFDGHELLGYYVRIKESSGEKEDVLCGRNVNEDKIKNDLFDIRHSGCVYSKARSGFHINNVDSVKTSLIDIISMKMMKLIILHRLFNYL